MNSARKLLKTEAVKQLFLWWWSGRNAIFYFSLLYHFI